MRRIVCQSMYQAHVLSDLGSRKKSPFTKTTDSITLALLCIMIPFEVLFPMLIGNEVLIAFAAFEVTLTSMFAAHMKLQFAQLRAYFTAIGNRALVTAVSFMRSHVHAKVT